MWFYVVFINFKTLIIKQFYFNAIALLPIIALTAGITQEERDRCLNCGMNGFVTKPINPRTDQRSVPLDDEYP